MNDQDKDEMEKMKEISGAVITIMGVPRDAKKEAVQQLVNEMSELALDNMSNVEVAYLASTPLFTAANIRKNLPEDMEEDVYQTAIGRAAGTIMAGVMMQEEQDHEREMAELRRADEAKLDELSPDEYDAEMERREKVQIQRLENRHQQRLAEIRNDTAEVFKIAEHWSSNPNLNKQEVAHGVAHDIYAKLGHDWSKHNYHDERFDRHEVYPTPSQSYQEVYTANFADDVKEGQMKAASALFGSK